MAKATEFGLLWSFTGMLNFRRASVAFFGSARILGYGGVGMLIGSIWGIFGANMLEI